LLPRRGFLIFQDVLSTFAAERFTQAGIAMAQNSLHRSIMASLLTLVLATSCVTKVNKHIIGQSAVIEVVDAGLAFKARIDTGAKRTSIHAVNIHVNDKSELMEENTGKEITFRVINEKSEEREIKTTIKDVSRVRNS
jgi:hypothetical protein